MWAAVVGIGALLALLTAGAVVMLTDAFQQPPARSALAPVAVPAGQNTQATPAALDSAPVALMQPSAVVPEPLDAPPADAAVAARDAKPPSSEPEPERPAMRRSASSMMSGSGGGQRATMWVSGTSFVTPHTGARDDADEVVERGGIASCWPAEVSLVGTDSYYISLTIRSNGGVASASLTPGMVQNGPPRLLSCIRAKLRALSFPPDPTTPSQEIQVTLTFRGI